MQTQQRPKWGVIAPLLGLVGLAVGGVYAHGLPLNSLSRPTSADHDCSNFRTQADAQAFFMSQAPGDWHQLDSDSDGKACESLPPQVE